MIEYYIHDPVNKLYLGRNFSGCEKPLYAIGFGSLEDAMSHLLSHVAEYIADYSFGELEIVKAYGQRRLINIKNGREYKGNEPFGFVTHSYHETVERVQ